MANLATMVNDLTLLGMAGLIQTDFQALLNKCQREEVESYPWSFLFTNIIVNGVVPTTSGTATATQGSLTVTGSAGVFSSTMAGSFIRVGATLVTPILIASSPDAFTLTLTTPYGAPTATNVSYSVFKLYFDVDPLIEVYDVKQIDWLLQTTQDDLNVLDPSRVSTGGNPSIRWAQGPFNTAGHYQIELWPSTTAALPYIVQGRKGPVDMVNGTDLPLLPSAVLEAKAMMYMARAAYASNGNLKWLQLAQQYNQDYLRELEEARMNDKKRVVSRGINAEGPLANQGLEIYSTHDFFGPSYQ